ncbi:MarR family transcriptional regulator [Streptomyces sp. NBC_01166]|uniref:MarR family transcriptional regulator n=1 Tax=Streptomyces sp. NBC_01166 TaxID=2903755 RepID=UPI003863898A|nr:MarR family transcriptional regulator [Streptomyces sp. NBC_01166]
MAIQHPSSAPPAPAASRPYRKAHTGYGKQTVPAQDPSGAVAFAYLPERERYVAGYVDHLPDGAAMDIKSLAKDLPLYGQMAIGTALRALAVAGHLRRVRCRVEGAGQCRWVTLTYWSRTAHDNEWWIARLAGEAAAGPEQAPAPSAEPAVVPRQRTAERPGPNPPPAPQEEPGVGASSAVAAPSPAYLTLAELGRSEPRLALSAADCAALEPLAAAWFTRGVGADYLTSALTAGLPECIGSPIGLVRRRLTDKMPPHLPTAPAPNQGGLSATPVRSVLVECADCGRPGPAEALPDGLCRPCATAHQPGESSSAAAPAEVERDVPALVASLRNLMRTP